MCVMQLPALHPLGLKSLAAHYANCTKSQCHVKHREEERLLSARKEGGGGGKGTKQMVGAME